MDHNELTTRVAALPGLANSWQYLFQWAADGVPTTAFLTLVPRRDGTVTATRGDNREKIEPFPGPDGRLLVFADEAAACDWAWSVILDARAPTSPRTEAYDGRALRSAEDQRRRLEEYLTGRQGEANGT